MASAHLSVCIHPFNLSVDLPYVYSTEGKIKEPNLAAEAGQGLLSAVSSYARGDMGGVFKSAMGIVKVASGNNKKAEEYTRRTKTSPADAVCFWLLIRIWKLM